MTNTSRFRAPDDTDRHISERMRARRVALGVTQTALGRAIGVSCQQVQKYEAGKNRMSASQMALAAQCLGVGLTYFHDNHEPELPPSEGARLLRAFEAITNEKVRSRFLALVEALAGSAR